MPTEKVSRKKESFEQKLKAMVIRIPINTTTVTAALLLVTQVIALAQVLKVPLEVEKVAPLEILPVPPVTKILTDDTKVIQP